MELVNGSLEILHHNHGRIYNKEAHSVLILPDTIPLVQNTVKKYKGNIIFVPSVVINKGELNIKARDSILFTNPFFLTENIGAKMEAKTEPVSQDTGWQFEYYLTDHLGNIRVSFTDKDNDGLITVALDSTNEVLEENHFYPFGMKMDGPWLARENLSQNDRYSYIVKEELPWTGYMD